MKNNCGNCKHYRSYNNQCIGPPSKFTYANAADEWQLTYGFSPPPDFGCMFHAEQSKNRKVDFVPIHQNFQ